MSNPTIVKPSDAAQSEVVTPTTTITHDAGQMVSSSALVTSPAVEQPQFFQQVPDNEITHFLERLVELDTWSFAGTDPPGVMLSIDPWTLFLAKASVVDKTFNYSLIRGDLELVFIIMTQPSAYGSYVITAQPNAEPTSTTTDVNTLFYHYNCMQLDHYARIDCASAENVVMQLPWTYKYDYAELPAGPNGSWAVHLSCLKSIQSGLSGAAATGRVRVFARLMPGYQLTVPKFQAGARRGHLKPTSSTATHMPAVHKQLTGGGKISGVADKIAGIADKLTGVPVIGGMAATVATAAHIGSKIAHAFGFSRDSTPLTPVTFATRSVTNLANYEGNDPSETAAFSQVCEISTDPTLAGSTSEDILAFTSLFARWTLIKTITWTQAAASGTDLANIPVSPSYCVQSTVGPNYDTYHPTVAGFVGMPFSYWRGDMEYQVIIPCSKFHRGSLQIFWCPVGSTPTTDVTNTTLNMIFDLGSGEEHQFTVGYARGRPYVYNAFLYDGSVINTDWTNGRLFFRVINPLTASNATADTSILVFARACANMDFTVPRQTINYGSLGTSYDVYNFLALQGGALGDEDNHDMAVTELVPASGTIPAGELYFGETLASVRALLQKPSRWYYRIIAGGLQTITNRAVLFPLGLLPDPYNLTAEDPHFAKLFTWQGWYRALFTGIACSERYKFVAKTQRIVGVAPIVNDQGTTVAAAGVPTLLPATQTGPQYGAEVIVPYYRPEKFLLGRRNYEPYTTTERFNMLYTSAGPIANGSGTGTEEVAVYHSYGPDIRVIGFRGVPQCLAQITPYYPGVPNTTNFFFQQ